MLLKRAVKETSFFCPIYFLNRGEIIRTTWICSSARIFEKSAENFDLSKKNRAYANRSDISFPLVFKKASI